MLACTAFEEIYSHRDRLSAVEVGKSGLDNGVRRLEQCFLNKLQGLPLSSLFASARGT